MSGKKLFFIQLIFAFFFTSFSYSVTEKEAVAQAEKNIEKAVSLLEMDKGWFKKENYSAAKAAVFEIKNNAQILWDFSLQDNGQNPGSTNESENMVYVCEDAVKFIDMLSLIDKENKKKKKRPSDSVAAMRKKSDAYSAALVTSAKNFSSYGRTSAAWKKSSAMKVLERSSLIKYPWKKFADAFSKNCTAVENLCTKKAISLWVEVSLYYSQTAEQMLSLDSENLDSAEEKAKSHPGQVLKEIPAEKENIAQDIAVLKESKLRLNDGYIYRANFIAQQENIDRTISELQKLNSRLDSLQDKSEQKFIKASIAEKEISSELNSAEKNIGGDLESSLKNIVRAQNLFSQIYDELNNDADILKSVRDRIDSIRDRTVKTQTPVFLSNMRSLKNSARLAYYAGNFEKAVDFLFEADTQRNLWSKLVGSEIETDRELERLKDFTNTAIAIKEGREIKSYDPKAPEMLKNLSEAKAGFEKAEYLISVGNEKEAGEILTEAKKRINQIKIYYPRNRDAGILSLKIDRLADPGRFSEVFKAKADTLVKTDYSANDTAARQSYSDLMDLQEINPEYPGLAETVVRAEIEMNLRPRPVSKKSAEKAELLLIEAETLLKQAGRDEIKLEAARDKAEEAQSLNSESKKAARILDEIALRTGSDSAVTLSAKDEDMYQAALKDLRNGNIIEASIKVSALLENNGNLQSAKVIRLKKRIEAQI